MSYLLQRSAYCLLLCVYLYDLYKLGAQVNPQSEEQSELERTFGSDSSGLETYRELQRLRNQQEREQLRQLERSRRSFKPSPHSDLAKELSLGRIFRKGRQCVHIKRIQINGDPYLRSAIRKSIAKDMLGRCLGPQEFEYLIRKTTNHYIEEGQITTRVYLPKQNLSDGVLDIRVVPGNVESIRFDEKAGHDSEIFMAFPFMRDKRLNLRDIEQGLEQINRLRSNKAKMRLLPGERTGGSHIIIERQQSAPWHLAVNFNNSGSEATGAVLSNVSLGLDNLMRLNDSWNISTNLSIVRGNKPENFTRSASINYSLPFGYWTIAYFFTQSEYQNIVPVGSDEFKSEGKTTIGNFSLDRIIYRGKSRKSTVSLAVKQKSSENFFAQTRLIASSRSSKTFKLDIHYSHFFPFANFGVNAGYIFGNLSGIAIGGNNLTNPAEEFSKIEGSMNMSMPFSYLKQKFRYQVDYQLQYTTDILHSDQQFSIGGLYTVRGYRRQGISADIGYTLRNELQWYWSGTYVDPQQSFLWGQPFFFIAYDLGLTEANTTQPNVGYLEGIALGIKSYGRYANVSLTLSQSVRWPGFLEREQAVWFAMGFQL